MFFFFSTISQNKTFEDAIFGWKIAMCILNYYYFLLLTAQIIVNVNNPSLVPKCRMAARAWSCVLICERMKAEVLFGDTYDSSWQPTNKPLIWCNFKRTREIQMQMNAPEATRAPIKKAAMCSYNPEVLYCFLLRGAIVWGIDDCPAVLV